MGESPAGYSLRSHSSLSLGDLVHAGRLRRDPYDLDALCWLLKRWLDPEPTDVQLFLLPLPLATALVQQVAKQIAQVSQSALKEPGGQQ